MKLPLLTILLLASGIVHAAGLRLHATLNGANVVSATDSRGTGEATALLDADGHLRLNLVYGGLASEVTGAAIHIGATDVNGPAAVPLEVRRNQTVGSLVDRTFDLSDEVAARMRAGETYIEVTTAVRPGGEIRGQLIPQPVRIGDEPEETGG